MPDEGDRPRTEDEAFERVLGAVERWTPPTSRRGRHATPVGDLRRHLDRDLNEGVDSAWQTHAVESPSGSNACDVVVDGIVGVKLVPSISERLKLGLQRELNIVTERYEYLILYGLDLQTEHVDTWRVMKRRTSADALGVRRIEVIEQFADEGDPVTPVSPSRLVAGSAVAGLVAALAIWIAVRGTVIGHLARLDETTLVFLIGWGMLSLFAVVVGVVFSRLV